MFSEQNLRLLAYAMFVAVSVSGCGATSDGRASSAPAGSSDGRSSVSDGAALSGNDDGASDAGTCSPLDEELAWMSDDGLPATSYTDGERFGCTWQFRDAVVAIDFRPNGALPDTEAPAVRSDHGYTSWFEGTPDEYTVYAMSDTGELAELYVLPAGDIVAEVQRGARWSIDFLHYVLSGQSYTGDIGTPTFGGDVTPLVQVDLDWLDPGDAMPSTERLAAVDLVRDGCDRELQQHLAVLLDATMGGSLAYTNDEVNGCHYTTPTGDTTITVRRASVRDFSTLDRAASYWRSIGWELTAGPDRVVVVDDLSDFPEIRAFFLDPTPMGESPWRGVDVFADSEAEAVALANHVIDLLMSARS